MKIRVKLRKKQIILGALFLLLALLTAACWITFSLMGGKLQSQQAAEQFRGESEQRFAQASAYFPVSDGKEISAVYTFRQALEKALTEASLEAPEGGQLWMDAYSGEAKLSVKGAKGSAEVPVMGVGGDWFRFHPLFLKSGQYLSEDDLMHDRVVLDEELAWKLFGSIDVAGMTVTIAEQPYIVAGVIDREDDFASKKAFSGEAGMFIYMDTLVELDEEAKINTYELVCVDPISGFALDILKKQFPEAVCVQNTGRFDLGGTIKVIRGFGERSMNTAGVIFPYWENAARYIEDLCALLLVAAVLFGIFPLVCIVWMIVFLYKRARGKLEDVVPEKWEKLSDNVREKQRKRLLEREARQYAKKDLPEPGGESPKADLAAAEEGDQTI